VQLRVPFPAIVVNPAAYTAVDQAEREPDLAFAITSGGPAVLADECQRLGALLVHYSTDYIFDIGVPNAPRRPMNSVLDNAKLRDVFGLAPPAWDESLTLCMQELRE
jgi:dTDP-4-dehydrorhamnose reductase